MVAIMKRELSAYFSSAIGYIFLAVYYFFSGLFFQATLASNTGSMTMIFANMFTIILFLTPILTMRLWSEEKKQKTDQALFTAPVKLLPVTLGKYFAALFVFVISLAINLVYAMVISFFTTPEWSVILGNMVGLFLLGAALIAIGMFISALTENQVIAAVGGFGVAFLVMLMDALPSIIPGDFFLELITNLSFNNHYNDFSYGILNLTDVVFFLSVIVLFVFLTVRVFEKKRWS